MSTKIYILTQCYNTNMKRINTFFNFFFKYNLNAIKKACEKLSGFALFTPTDTLPYPMFILLYI